MSASRPALGRQLDQLLQHATTNDQDGPGVFDSSHSLRQLFGVGARDLLRTDQLAREYQFPSPEAVRQYLRRKQVPYLTRGRILLVDRRDFEASMTKARTARLARTA